jgi:hypothetical protein
MLEIMMACTFEEGSDIVGGEQCNLDLDTEHLPQLHIAGTNPMRLVRRIINCRLAAEAK